jgi:hypothetical protein
MVRTVWKVWCAGIWPGIRAGRDDGEAILIALLAILGVDLIVGDWSRAPAASAARTSAAG